MGIGHVAVGLGLKRMDRRVNVGWLIFAALLPDFLLGWFTLAGWETYAVPANFASGHYLLFTFPWSHGLLAHAVWAALAGFTAWRLTGRRIAAAAIGIAVLSHFLLDGIVHVQGLPLVGAGPLFGLGLWRWLPLALAIEGAMAVLALWFLPGRRIGMTVYIALLAVFLIVGQAAGSEVPPRTGLIASWLIAPPLMAAIAGWLDRKKRRAANA